MSVVSNSPNDDSLYDYPLVKQAESILNQALDFARLDGRVSLIEKRIVLIEDSIRKILEKEEQGKTVSDSTAEVINDSGDGFHFAIPWLQRFSIHVPMSYHAQVSKECKGIARGYDPRAFRRRYNDSLTLRFKDETLADWVELNSRDPYRSDWFREFKRDVYESRHDRSVEPPRKTNAVITWIMDRFRERREWNLDILLSAARQAGFGKHAILSPEIFALPIRRTILINGDKQEWTWRACRYWPPMDSNEIPIKSSKS